MIFSSGGSVAASATVDIGQGAQTTTATESNVYQMMSASASFGHFYCSGQKQTAGASITFTLRQFTPSGGSFGTATNVATCTVATGAVSGVSSGTFALVTGDVYDVQVATGNVAGGVTAALGP